MVRRSVAMVFLLLGTNVLTYACVRYTTTERVLRKAGDMTQAFLEDHNLIYGLKNSGKADLVIPEGLQVESKTLLGRISLAGGMYYWWNDALPFYGLGILLCSLGILLPWAKPRGARTS